MESDIPEESIRAEVSLLLRFEENLADRVDDLVEFRLDHIAELETAGAFRSLDLVVVRKVDGDGLSAGIGITCIIDGIVDEHVRLGSRHESLVFFRTREGFLEFRKQCDVFGEFFGLLQVLQEDEALV